MKYLIYLLNFFWSLLLAQAIMFNLPPNTQKCLKEDMQAHQLVAGEYEVSTAPNQKVDYVVSCSRFISTIPCAARESNWDLGSDPCFSLF